MTASENELNQIGEPLRKKEGGLYKAGASKVGDYLEVLLVLHWHGGSGSIFD